MVEQAKVRKVTARKAAQEKRTRPQVKASEEAQGGPRPRTNAKVDPFDDVWDSVGNVAPFDVIKVRLPWTI